MDLIDDGCFLSGMNDGCLLERDGAVLSLTQQETGRQFSPEAGVTVG